MSYEGYVQELCANGHLSTRGCYDRDGACAYCGAEIAWRNGVDQTNGCDYTKRGKHSSRCPCGAVEDDEFVVAAPAVVEHCDACGSSRVIEPTRYAVPAKWKRQRRIS